MAAFLFTQAQGSLLLLYRTAGVVQLISKGQADQEVNNVAAEFKLKHFYGRKDSSLYEQQLEINALVTGLVAPREIRFMICDFSRVQRSQQS